MKTNRQSWMLITLIVLLICSTPLIARAQLFDGEREGLLIGGGLGFAAVAAGDSSGESFSGSGFSATGKIGYGLSDQLTLYFSTPVTSLVPSLGFMYYPDRRSDYYLQGVLGYTSANQDSIVSIAGGIGYELRDHVTLEGMLGYNRFSYTYTSYGWFSRSVRDNTINIITIAATFNVYFY